jgi:hypothetical protein
MRPWKTLVVGSACTAARIRKAPFTSEVLARIGFRRLTHSARSGATGWRSCAVALVLWSAAFVESSVDFPGFAVEARLVGFDVNGEQEFTGGAELDLHLSGKR